MNKLTNIIIVFFFIMSCTYHEKDKFYKLEIRDGMVLKKSNLIRNAFYVVYSENEQKEVLDEIRIFSYSKYYQIIDSGTILNKTKNSFWLGLRKIKNSQIIYIDSIELKY